MSRTEKRGLVVAATAGLLSCALAAAMIWWLLSEPVQAWVR
jgi:hypothetical protein